MEELTSHGINGFQESIPILGIALLLALVADKVAKRRNVPKVTAYILVGIFLGPSALNILTEEITHQLSFINDIAFGLILFNIGGEFNRDLFQKIAKKQVQYSFLVSLFIFLTVGGICFLFSFFTDFSLTERLIASCLFGVIAIEAAPPTTVLVLKEYGAQGPLTQSILVYLAMGTFISIIASKVAISAFQGFGLWSGGEDISFFSSFTSIVWSPIGSVLLGVILGFLLSYWEQKEKKQGELLFAVVCVILFGRAVAHYLNADPLLLSLVLGVTVANASSVGREIHKQIKDMGLSIYALFFIFAGAHIHLQENLKQMGIMGLAYIIARLCGILFSSRLAAKMLKEEEKIIQNKGLSILSHAGAALAIVFTFKNQPEVSAQTVVTVIMTSIFFFELVGPFALRFALLRAEEIKTAGSISDPTSKAPITFRSLYKNFLLNLGLKKSKEFGQMQTITHIVKTDVVAIQSTATVSEVTKFIESHQYPIYPVVDADHHYEGILSLPELKRVVLNQDDSTFMRAHALIGSIVYIPYKATLAEASETFHRHNVEALPVVNPETKKLVGIITYKAVLMARKSEANSSVIID